MRFDDLGGMDVLGMILTPPRGWNARPDNPARVILNSGLGPMDARVAYAHEVGHGLCHHVGMMSSLALGLEDKHEREAWEIASLLLIPERVVLEEKEVVRIAAACEVPEWLVEIWPLISV